MSQSSRLPAAVVAAAIGLLASAAVAGALAWGLLPATPVAVFALTFAACLLTALLTQTTARASASPAAASARQQDSGRQRQRQRREQPTRERQPRDRQRSRAGATEAPDTKGDGAREQGEVKWFNRSKGFGFIIRPNGDEVFVHYRNIRGRGRQYLQDGQQVDYVVVTRDRGPQADDVVRLREEHA